MTSFLKPVLIAIYPRWSEAAEVVTEALSGSEGECAAIALAEDEIQAALFRSHWADRQLLPLLLFHTTHKESAQLAADVVLDISKRDPTRPVGVLIADGPDASGFEGRDWNRALGRQISEVLADVQVFEYSRTWATSPPRVR